MKGVRNAGVLTREGSCDHKSELYVCTSYQNLKVIRGGNDNKYKNSRCTLINGVSHHNNQNLIYNYTIYCHKS